LKLFHGEHSQVHLLLLLPLLMVQLPPGSLTLHALFFQV
jgi:hypothetical protein